jgi:hypothetical protein
MCCENDRYCYLDKNWQPKCCSLGNKCDDSNCGDEQLYCNTTLTVTTHLGTATTGTPTVRVDYTTSSACCQRACGASSFSCESEFGGQCCPYGFKCASTSQCIADPVPSTSTFVSTIVPEIPAGCTTSQISCAATDGGGCCGVGSFCTFQSVAHATSKVCAPNSTFADGDGGGSTALSSSARVGVGVGVALGAAIIIAAVTWLCIRRRRRHKNTNSNVSAHEMGHDAAGNGAGGVLAAATGGGRGGRKTGRGRGIRESLLAAGPSTPWTRRSNFTGVTSPTISSARPALHDHGRVYSYFGPDAIAGPFTDREGNGHDIDAALATTPPTGPLSSDGTGRFVTPGSMPFDADHIWLPEMGANETRKDIKQDKENLKLVIKEETARQDEDLPTGPFELMGSLDTPPPMESNDKAAQTQPKK